MGLRDMEARETCPSEWGLFAEAPERSKGGVAQRPDLACSRFLNSCTSACRSRPPNRSLDRPRLAPNPSAAGAGLKKARRSDQMARSQMVLERVRQIPEAKS